MISLVCKELQLLLQNVGELVSFVYLGEDRASLIAVSSNKLRYSRIMF